MARKPRVHYPGAVYHVIVRGNNQEYILASDLDKSRYIEIIKKYKDRFSFHLYGYTIMDNHVHMLIEVQEHPLSKIMQGIQQSYTQWYNHFHGRVGHVFQQRYKAILCDKDSYLLTLLKYIHNNPIRAGIHKTLDYPWSSHRDYLLGSSSFVDMYFCLGILSNQKGTAINNYLQFMEQPEPLRIQEQIKMSNVVPSTSNKNNEWDNLTRKISLDELIEMVIKKFGVLEEALLGLKSRNRRIIMARNIVIYLAIKHEAAIRTDLMENLNLTPYQISRGYYAAPQKEESLAIIHEIEEKIAIMQA